MSALEKLRARAAETADLRALDMLATWDQLVMMPSEGAPDRASQLGTLARIRHDRATAAELGEWLAELEQAELGELDADVVRLARRDWERARRVPSELAAELSEAHAAGHERWREARAADDFSIFAPALERNVQLAQAYGGCLAEEDGAVYQALIYDYDYGLRTDDLRRLFSELGERLSPLLEQARGRGPVARPEVPREAQQGAVESILRRVGVEERAWRLDVSAHPFSASMARGDQRITTRYEDGGIESLLSSLHEFGHALYERQIDPRLDRTNLAGGTSMSIHESQSKLWENHVARHPAFAGVLAEELAAAGYEIDSGSLHAGIVAVEPSLIRVSADPVTYPLHIVLRFELELALIDGDLAVADLPAAWRDGMRRLLGVEVPSDALGCLQDVHWSEGAFGYFPSYAMGCLIAASLWEALERDQGPQQDALARGEVGAIKEWLGARIHRYGRRFDTVPLVEQATGRGLEIEPFLRYASPFASVPL
ncbi:MAG TPA: carboxypeptidase M32 [Solirubrobacteraceae bacterium]